MAPIGDGEFTYRIPALDADSVVNYYVVATDESVAKSYFPETAPDTNANFTVENGNPLFISVELSNENPPEAEDIIFTVNAYDVTGVDEIRLYYVLDDADAETKNRFELGQRVTYYLYWHHSWSSRRNKNFLLFKSKDVSGLRTYLSRRSC